MGWRVRSGSGPNERPARCCAAAAAARRGCNLVAMQRITHARTDNALGSISLLLVFSFLMVDETDPSKAACSDVVKHVALIQHQWEPLPRSGQRQRLWSRNGSSSVCPNESACGARPRPLPDRTTSTWPRAGAHRLINTAVLPGSERCVPFEVILHW